jgi:hypothetical protein
MGENLPNKVDQLFNDALQKFKDNPSENVWDKIEEKLDDEDRKIAYFSHGWKKYVAVVILLIVGSGLFLIMYNKQETILTQESAINGKADKRTILSPKKDIPAHDHEKSKSVLSDIVIPAASDFTSSDSTINLKQKVSMQRVETGVRLVSINAGTFLLKGVTSEPLTVIHPKERFKDRLSVTPYFSQEFAGYSLTDNDLTGVNGQEIEERERNVFSASVGFFINYKINKRWVLQSGISYSWSNSNIDSAISYAVKDNSGNVQYKLNTISGYGYLKPSSLIQPSVGDSISTAKSFSQLHYLTVPLVLSYRIPLRRFSLLIGGGVSFNMLTGSEIETKTYGHGDPEKEYSVNMMGLKKVNYGMLVKLDMEYHLTSNMGVNIIPCFKNTLSPINLQSAITAYPYNFGIGVGFTYRF